MPTPSNSPRAGGDAQVSQAVTADSALSGVNPLSDPLSLPIVESLSAANKSVKELTLPPMTAPAHESSLDDALGLAGTVTIDLAMGVKDEVIDNALDLFTSAMGGATTRFVNGPFMEHDPSAAVAKSFSRPLPPSLLLGIGALSAFSLRDDINVLADPADHSQGDIKAANQNLQNIGEIGADFIFAGLGYYAMSFLDKKLELVLRDGAADANDAKHSFLGSKRKGEIKWYRQYYPTQLAANPSLGGFIRPGLFGWRTRNYSAFIRSLAKSKDPDVLDALVSNSGLGLSERAKLAELPSMPSRSLAKAALHPDSLLSEAAKANPALNEADRLRAVDIYAGNVRTSLEQHLLGEKRFGDISFPQSNADLADPSKPIVIKWLTTNVADRENAFYRVKKLADEGTSLVIDDGTEQNTFPNRQDTNGVWERFGHKFLEHL
jgi:hypothetical protein